MTILYNVMSYICINGNANIWLNVALNIYNTFTLYISDLCTFKNDYNMRLASLTIIIPDSNPRMRGVLDTTL